MTDIVDSKRRELMERVWPWRCDVTKNPVGTDTVMIGAKPCNCQGCRAHAEILSLRQQRDEALEVLARLVECLGDPIGPGDTDVLLDRARSLLDRARIRSAIAAATRREA